ncbi:MAG: peptide chain release factor N(5)-glutamine methyltransferase [Pseudomonadota bacterium]
MTGRQLIPSITMNVLEALKWATEALSLSGVPEPAADAGVLLAHLLGISRPEIFLSRDRILLPGEEERLKKYIGYRASRRPLQYILGEEEFWSLLFKVTPDVLIPRPETEILVETVLKRFRREVPLSGCFRALDLCTGSGILAIVLAKELGCLFYAADISGAALSIARENAERHQVTSAITFLEGDLFEPFRGKKGLFDLIVSNPPYVPIDVLSDLMPEVKDYEPRRALDGGLAGLSTIRRIIDEAPLYLMEDGWMFLEIGHGQSRAVLDDMEGRGVFRNISVVPDYSGIDRVVYAQKV